MYIYIVSYRIYIKRKFDKLNYKKFSHAAFQFSVMTHWNAAGPDWIEKFAVALNCEYTIRKVWILTAEGEVEWQRCTRNWN